MTYLTLENVSLDYPLYDSANRSFMRSITKTIPVGGVIKKREGNKSSILALDSINASFKSGDRVALLGHNGAGKSSLLKLLAGFYEPTSGKLSKQGKVSALLSLTAGMDAQISGYDNILLCGMLRGLSRKQVLDKMNDIAEFSELGTYLHMPIRLYSDGMMLRLAFSVCASMEYEILLMDEWFGTGDLAFLDKAKQRLSQIIHSSSILVFATHSAEVARQLCNKALYLEHGKVIYQGKIDDVLLFQQEQLAINAT